MFRICFTLGLIMLLNSCIEKNNNQNIELNQDLFEDFEGFRCDTLQVDGNKMTVFITDDFPFFDPIISQQKTVFALRNFMFDNNLCDTLYIHFDMPNRESGGMEIETSVNDIENARIIYEDSTLIELMNYLIPKENGLGGLNADFAYFIYGNEAVDKAFFGVNSMDVIYQYRQDCQLNGNSINKELITRYQAKINQLNPDQKKISEKILSIIECDN